MISVSSKFALYSLSTIAVALFLLSTYLRHLLRRPNQQNTPLDSLYDLEQDEYDFLGSTEGVPSKLDLARAYIAMNKTDKAKSILIHILQTSKNAYHTEAKELLEQI